MHPSLKIVVAVVIAIVVTVLVVHIRSAFGW